MWKHPFDRSPRASLGPGLVPCLALALALAATAVRAADEAPAPVTETAARENAGDAPGATVFAPTRRPAPNGFAARLRETDARHRADLAALRERLAAAERSERPAIQREIEALKQARHAGLVMAQVERARRDGREDLARRLELRLARLRASGAASAPAVPGGAR